MKRSIIQKALANVETAWEEMKHAPIKMTAEEFEKRLLKMAKRHGLTYSQEKGKWLDMAKKDISGPNLSQEEKSLYLAEVSPPEFKRAERKFNNAFSNLHTAIEWAYKDLDDFINDTTKDKRLRRFLLWRAMPIAEAYHKVQKLDLRGKITKEQYWKLHPVVSIRTS